MTKQKEPAWQKEPDRQKEIAGIFPDYMREKWRQALSRADKLQEIRGKYAGSQKRHGA